MAMRMSGLMSGMDTESIVQQLVEVRSKKVTKVKNSQTKLEWKQDIWKGLNTKLKTLQSKLNDLRFSSGYAKKVTKSSNEGIASVLTSDSAVNGVHTLEVNRMAKTAYLTGGKVARLDGREIEDITKTQMADLMEFTGQSKRLNLTKEDGSQVEIELTWDMTISDLQSKFREAGLNANFDTKQNRFFISTKDAGDAGNFMITGDRKVLQTLGLGLNQEMARPQWLSGHEGGAIRGSSRLDDLIAFSGDATDNSDLRRLEVTTADGVKHAVLLEKFTKDEDGIRHFNTVDDLVQQFKKAGVDVVYDQKEGAFFFEAGIKDIKSSKLDTDGKTWIDDSEVVNALGMNEYMSSVNNNGGKTEAGTFVRGQDAEITLNGATFTSTNNTFEINGLTITAQNTTEEGKSITLTTQQDTDGIYDMVKDFFKTYNEIINEMDKLYNGESAKDYEPLSDAEKETMSEKEVEKYEQKIKDSLLRRDGSLGTLSTALKKVMLSSFSVNGKTMNLTNFGISTLNYFAAPDNERNAYHIDGDKDDTNTSGNEDKLKSLIASDPDTVISFFTQLSQSLYTEMNEKSRAVEGYRSFGSFYDDKKMKTDYDDYKSKIKEEEKKLADYEDKWYAKFAKMESAMAKMQQNASAVTGLLGGQ